MNVEKLVNLTLEETVVEAHHERVLFGTADRGAAVSIVKTCCTLLLVVCRYEGLTSAAYAAAGASHDLNEVEVLAGLDALDDSLSVVKSACNCDVESNVAVGIRGCLRWNEHQR